MRNNIGTSARKTNACLAVLALALLAPLGAALGSTAGSSASSNATLSAFADGSVSKTLSFAAGANADTSVFLRLPQNATVADAALDASVAGSSSASSGAAVFDVGADGSADATASLSVLATTRVTLPAAAFNAYLHAQGAASGSIDVPVRVTGAAASSWSVQLSGLVVDYAAAGDLLFAPRLTSEIGALAVASGQENGSVVDLAGHFTAGYDSNLTFSAQLAADAQAAASGVSLIMNGSKVDVRSDNANWWGDVSVRFAAADAHGQVALSNDVTVHVTPGPVEAPTTRTDAKVGVEAVVLAACGSPAVVGTITVPADAVVTQARMSIEGAADVTSLGGTIGVLAGLEAVAGANLSQLPTLVELNASALNAEIRGSASSWGLVDLDLAADVCPSGAAAEVRAGNISVTYTRGAVNATSPTQIIAGITLDGKAAGEVASDTALRLALQTNGSVASGTQVSWYLDGRLAGSGSAIEGVTFSRGNHTVEARATAGAMLAVYSTTVRATPQASAQAAIAIDGIVTAAVKSGTTLIVELRTPEPMSAGANVEWYVDGRFAGRGQVLANVTLAPGTHTVEARSTEGGTVHSYAAQVTAAPVPFAVNLTAALLACAALVACAAGAVAWRRRR